MATAADARTAASFLGAAIATAIAGSVYLAVVGYDDAGLADVLRYSGRVAFAVLIVVFAARPLQQLLKKPWTATLLRNRRQVGVAFAGIHTAHLMFIALRIHGNAEMTFGILLNPGPGLIYLLIFAMLVTSFSAPARKIGNKAWKALHKTGLFVIFAAFLPSQLPLGDAELEPGNAALIVLATAAILVRVAAFFRNLR